MVYVTPSKNVLKEYVYDGVHMHVEVRTIL